MRVITLLLEGINAETDFICKPNPVKTELKKEFYTTSICRLEIGLFTVNGQKMMYSSTGASNISKKELEVNISSSPPASISSACR